ncbi:exo-alpha-sialidase [candidate division KSB1 bacterium]|nr:exo-alpha-sialidase [candidate division KSB1 bacterium]
MKLKFFVLSLFLLFIKNISAAGDKPFFKEQMVHQENAGLKFSHGSTIVELTDGTLFCTWYAGSREKGDDVAIVGSWLKKGSKTWSKAEVIIDMPGKSEGNPVLFLDRKGLLWLFYQTMYGSGEGRTKPGTGWTTCKVKAITSKNGGRTWSKERILIDEFGYLTRNKPLQLDNGSILLPIHDERNWSSRILISKNDGVTWEMSEPIDCGLGFHDGNIEPALLEKKDGSILCYMRTGFKNFKTWKSISTDGGYHWSQPVEIEVPNTNAALDLLRLSSGNVVLALNPIPGGDRRKLSLWLSTDDAESWTINRTISFESKYSSYPALIQTKDGLIQLTCSRPNGGIKHFTINEDWIFQDALISKEYKLPNVVPALDYDDDVGLLSNSSEYYPVKDEPFIEHVRGKISADEEKEILNLFDRKEQIPKIKFVPKISSDQVTSMAKKDGTTWIGTQKGLYVVQPKSKKAFLHENYGVDGPLATRITDLAVDSKGVLWVGTPLGLSLLKPDGSWHSIQGKDGLPVEDITSLAVDKENSMWIGTTKGAILYCPYKKGRQWFYRAGKRYLEYDEIVDIVISPEGMAVYFKTKAGLSRLDGIQRTLNQKADIIEDRVNKWHRRLGLVAACMLNDAENPTSHTIGDNDNDGLWTSYHVVAMSLAYGATGNEAYKESARKGMHALVMLQNASGIPGLVARSVVTLEEGNNKSAQWRKTPDGKMYWKSDTSSDEIDGHFFAFYVYWQHIARFDPVDYDLIQKQIRTVIDYIVDNNYMLIDWDGERTRWGFWNPENLNDSAEHYIENGLNAAQILSFLKVAFHITENQKYKEHYEYLISEHGYLGNVLLEKKVFPDENNHSDNQLGFCALYPLIQLEHDPKARNALQRAVRRHYKTLWKDGSSFFYFAAATIDPDFVDIKGAVTNLRQIPTDRRQWRMTNSHRTDIKWHPRSSRFGRPQLLHVLPADERNWAKWNSNPYYPDGGGDGRFEDDGASWLLAYWMGRYHGFISE